MKSVTIEKASNGYVVVMPISGPSPTLPAGQNKFVFATFGEVTAFLTEQEFIAEEA